MNAPTDLRPVFRREGDSWQALPQAQGPFGGMHGGAVAVADMPTLFTVTDAGERPNASGWPNAGLSLHPARAPAGPWTGIAQRGTWHGDGRGMTESEIFDAYGRIGRSCQSVVLLPAM